jgi:hypothetical protein
MKVFGVVTTDHSRKKRLVLRNIFKTKEHAERVAKGSRGWYVVEIDDYFVSTIAALQTN